MGDGRLDSILGSYSIPRVDFSPYNPSKNTGSELSPIYLSFYRNDLPGSGRTVKEVETWSQEEVEHLRREPSEHLRRKPSEHLRRKPFDHYRRLSAVWQHSQLAVLNSVDSLFSLL